MAIEERLWAVGFLDVEDEFMGEEDGNISLEDEEEESDSDDLEDYETEVDYTGDAGDGTLRVNCVPTNGSMVIIMDLSSWLRSLYIWIYQFSHI